MDKLFQDEPVVLVDAYAWIFRAYYALPDFRNQDGQPTSAVHGFLSIFPKIISFVEKKYGAAPEFVVFFDRGGPQERLAAYADYKANRPETPEDLKSQVPLIEEALSALSIPQVAIHGVEADDAIGSAATAFAGQGRRVVIASNDKDFFQILADDIRLLRPSGRPDDFVLMDPKSLKEKYGLPPDRMVDFFALVGDAVDNVPGVKGIGEKTAVKILGKYATLEEIYDNLTRLPKVAAKALLAQRSEAFLSRDLVRLRLDLEVDVIPVPFDPARFDRDKLGRILNKLELKRLAEKFLGDGPVGD